MKKAAIIIVNWNGKGFLKNCLDAVFKQADRNFEVYLVDNGSVDKSSDYVKNNFPKVKIISLDKNYGFAKGNNEGIKEALKDKKVEYIVCLNNDTIVDKYWLKELIKTAEKDEKIGAVSSKAYFTDGLINNAGLGLERALQVNKDGGISLGYRKKDLEVPKLSKEIEIFAPGGVAPLYRRKMLEKAYAISKEYFDEDFFAYAEDLDLGFRSRLMGWKAVLSPKAKLIHLHSSTGKKASPFKAYYCERNTIFTAIKNLSLQELLLFPYYNLKIKFLYARDKNKSVKELDSKIGLIGMMAIMLKIYLSILVHLPKLILKRLKIQNSRVIAYSNSRWLNKFSRESIENAN